MSFLQRIRISLARFMQGRNGADHLGLCTLVMGLVFGLLSSLLASPLLSLMGMAFYVWTLLRMFSKNIAKRQAENRRYLALTGVWKTKLRQFRNRVKNSKQYKYFRCPKCRAILRLTRGCGEKEVACPRCQHHFKKKA